MTFDRQTVLRWMRSNAADFRDAKTDEINCTALAESCADTFEQNQVGGPLDDPDH